MTKVARKLRASRRRRRSRGLRFLRLVGAPSTPYRRQLLDDLARGELSEAERGVQVLHLGKAVLGGHPLEVRLACLGDLYPDPPRFLFEVLLADLDRFGPLAGVNDGADLVACARGLDQREPVLARRVARTA